MKKRPLETFVWKLSRPLCVALVHPTLLRPHSAVPGFQIPVQIQAPGVFNTELGNRQGKAELLCTMEW